MPNWCMNRLTVSGPDHGRMAALWGEGDVFSKTIPQPETFSEADLAELEEYSRSTFLRQSHITAEDAWWRWRIKHWGVKWDVDEAEVAQADGETVITFCTPWSAPTAGIQSMSALYPDLCFTLVYCEPGMHFAGQAVFSAGEVRSSAGYEGGEEYYRLAIDLGCEDEDDEEEAETVPPDWRNHGF